MGPESSKYLASYPFHYLVMARDEDLFFKQLARFEGDEDALRSVLSQKLKNGDSLGHSAVREQSTRVLKWLAEHNPTLLREMGHSVGNPAHLAVNLERLSAMKILLEKTPDLFFHQDQSGYHPADYAGIQLNGEFINEIHRMKPELLKMKNAVEFTPLKYVKVIDREFYRRLKNQLYPWYHRLGSWCLSSWFARSSS
jgi:ankyrin repeat protein